MPDYPQAIYDKATAAVITAATDFGEDGIITADLAADLAKAVLDAIAADLGDYAAGKIEAHRDAHGPQDGARLSGWGRHFGIAARIAAGAFLTEDDLKRLAAEAVMRDDYVALSATFRRHPVKAADE